MEKNLWENLKGVFRRYRWRFAKAMILVLLANILMVLNPLVFRQAVAAMDKNAGQVSGILGGALRLLLGDYLGSLWAWALLLLCIGACAASFKYCMRIAFIKISRDIERDVRSKLFVRMQEQSMAFYDRHGTGELLSRLSNDISSYRDVMGFGIMYPVFFSTLLIPGLLALFSISPILTGAALVPLFAIPVINFMIQHEVYSLSHKVQKGLADLSNMTQEQYSGIRIIKGYAAEKPLDRLFCKLSRVLKEVNIKLNCFQGVLYPFFGFLTRVITIVLVIFASLIIIKAWETLSAADFVSFMWLQAYIFFPILLLGWVMPIYQRGQAAYERLVEVYAEPIEVKNINANGLHIAPGADIEFRNLSFTYPTGQREILKNFSLHIQGGTFVGITGPVGAGKTTLLRLLNREYEIPLGKLLIGGHDIHDYQLEALWNEMVTVEQAPFLFSRTIAENVRFGNADALQKDVEIVSQYADLHETVLGFPQQYETIIGERGVTLSGGQKQRLALARALLVDRSILLLDDVFAALDSETEMRIFKTIQSKLKQKTVILITHKVSVLEALDRVIYMQNGEILEDGSPKDLRGQRGYYAALVELQKPHLGNG